MVHHFYMAADVYTIDAGIGKIAIKGVSIQMLFLLDDGGIYQLITYRFPAGNIHLFVEIPH